MCYVALCIDFTGVLGILAQLIKTRDYLDRQLAH